MVRMTAEQLSGLDAWIETLAEPKLTRPEAMRRLARIGMERTGQGEALRRLIADQIEAPVAEADADRLLLVEKCEALLAELKCSYER